MNQPAPTPAPAPLDDYETEARRWLADVYQGDRVRQLSVRSIVTGMLIGGLMSISNLYVGLKTGWGLGVTITACIIAYAVFRALEAVVPAVRRDPFTILENNTMSSCASAAGYISTAGLVSSVPALYLTTGRQLLWWEMMAWIGSVALLGVFMAVPLKRQLINIDRLPFPSGIATAETLRSLHSSGAEALAKAKALLVAGFVGAVIGFWKNAIEPLGGWVGRITGSTALGEQVSATAVPDSLPFWPADWARTLQARQELSFSTSLIMVGAGAIMGIRVGTWMLIGTFAFWGVLGYWTLEQGITKPGFKGIVSWTLWPATSMLVTSGLLAFALRWRTILRAFAGLAAIVGRGRADRDPLAHVEVPSWWFLIGTTCAGTSCILLGIHLFNIQWWMGLIAVAVTFALSIVAARATGETDVTPIGAMGKITQLIYGVLSPADMQTNLMTATVTAGAASHSADLLTDLKCGYLLGGNPRKQTISQLFGVLAGAMVCIPVYTIIVKPAALESGQLAAPAARVWAGVAEILAKGLEALPQYALHGIVVGAIVGIGITLLEEFTPKQYRKWVPSATGLALAGVIRPYDSIAMFLGSAIAWYLSKAAPKTGEKYTVSVASGLIAGESLMGAAVSLWLAVPGLIQELWGSAGAK